MRPTRDSQRFAPDPFDTLLRSAGMVEPLRRAINPAPSGLVERIAWEVHCNRARTLDTCARFPGPDPEENRARIPIVVEPPMAPYPW